MQLQRTDLEYGGCADEFWRDSLLEKEERCAPFVSDLVLELARWETPLPREWLTLMLPASASSFGQWVSSGWYVGCASCAADGTERPRLSLTVPSPSPPSLPSPRRPTVHECVADEGPQTERNGFETVYTLPLPLAEQTVLQLDGKLRQTPNHKGTLFPSSVRTPLLLPTRRDI